MDVGIIGGADGPTSVFVTSSFGLGAAMALLAGLFAYLTIKV